MTATALGSQYEHSLKLDVKKARGVYYTPAFLAQYIVDRTLGILLRDVSSVEELLKIKIHDPACGTGNFLVAAFEYLVRWSSERFGHPNQDLRHRIQRHCLFGSDVDAEAIEIARAILPKANFVCADALIASSPCYPHQFDVIIGNPPYGAETLQKGDSTRLFMHRAHELLTAKGLHAFIVPKPLLYSSTWHSTLKFFMPGIYEIVDCGKVWPEVKLEQVIYCFAGAGRSRGISYRSCVLEGNQVRILGDLARSSFAEFGFALNGISKEELKLGQKLRSTGARLSDFFSNRRGAPLQASLKSRSGHSELAALGGKQIERYGLSKIPKGYFTVTSAAVDSRARISAGSILVQNIVAHVQRPEPHLKIIATLPPANCQSLIVDTVNQLTSKSCHAPEFFLGILNSKVISWYVYRFVVGRAIRTIHFDSPLSSRIPMPGAIDSKLHDDLVVLVREMLKGRSQAVDTEIELLVLRLFGLEKGVARAVRGIGV